MLTIILKEALMLDFLATDMAMAIELGSIWVYAHRN
jgi:hypothetical protein